MPIAQNLQDYREYVQFLPDEDQPEIFGLNDNANLNYQIKETNMVIETI